MSAHDCEDCRDALTVLRRLLEWERQLGGWEAPCWRDAARLAKSLDAAAEPEPVEPTDPWTDPQ